MTFSAKSPATSEFLSFSGDRLIAGVVSGLPSKHLHAVVPLPRSSVAQDNGITLAQGDGSSPDVRLTARAPGDQGVSLVLCQFQRGLWAHGASRNHMIFLTLRCQRTVACRVAGRRLDHVAPTGNVTLCPAGAPVTADGGGDYGGIVLFVPKETLSFAAAEREQAGATLVEQCRGANPKLLALGRAMVQQASERFIDGPLAWGELTAGVVQCLVDAHLSAPPPRSRGRLGEHAMTQVIDYVHANLDGIFGVDELADVAGKSRSHFPRLFRRSVGLSPYQYVLHARLTEAFALLRAGRLPIADVALRTGFADQSHLSRWMRRMYGATPRQLSAKRHAESSLTQSR